VRLLQFFYRAMQICIEQTDYTVDVRLSSRPYVSRRYCVVTAKRVIKLIFHNRVATPFRSFHTKRYGNISTDTP